MPRVRAKAGNTTLQIPLNDDREEKAQRLQSRQVAHTKQLETYRAAAASPAKKRKSLGNDNGPGTPSQPSQQDTDGYAPAGTAITPMKRVPILANFEEWMKMATDNKINATNSWNFALIDYFHDMSLLREGDGVNFQKASCTLDGCVKIYTSRVDSVATETGRLLSGLAESKEKKKRRGGGEEGEGEGEDEDEDEEGEGEGGKKRKKREKRSAEVTLAASFEQLRLKKMELEFSVDPLFKKASADFDEGGAKGLLLNHLSIDSTGRIVFDSSDDAQEQSAEEGRRDSMDPAGVAEEGDGEKESAEAAIEDGPVDIAALGARFFPDLSTLDSQDICSRLKTFELGSDDTSLDLPYLKAPENWRDEHPESTAHQDDQTNLIINTDDPAGFGLDDDNDADAFDLPPTTGFGEGGEAWARDAKLHHFSPNDGTAADSGEEGGEVGTFDTHSNAYGVTLQHRGEHDTENILNYFDAALQNSNKNWAGPEHWKIAKIKEATKKNAAQPAARTRKEKEPFEIDFASEMSAELASQLFTEAGSNAQISLPRREWRSRTRNLLPDDKHFNSKDLLKLFLKPKARLGSRLRPTTTRGSGQAGAGVGGGEEGGEIDEAYWANTNTAPQGEVAAGQAGDYNVDFFQDDNLPLANLDAGGEDDDDFADAREHFSPGIADDVDAAGPQGPGIDGVVVGAGHEDGGGGAFGANLVAQSRRLRPEYVQYARVAKKVDVRRLKEEMWRGIGFEGGELLFFRSIPDRACFCWAVLA